MTTVSEKKKRFNVAMPITGIVTLTVEAEDHESAIAAFWAAIESSDEPPKEELEWEYTPEVTSGNVCYAMQNSVEVDEVKS